MFILHRVQPKFSPIFWLLFTMGYLLWFQQISHKYTTSSLKEISVHSSYVCTLIVLNAKKAVGSLSCIMCVKAQTIECTYLRTEVSRIRPIGRLLADDAFNATPERNLNQLKPSDIFLHLLADTAQVASSVCRHCLAWQIKTFNELYMF